MTVRGYVALAAALAALSLIGWLSWQNHQLATVKAQRNAAQADAALSQATTTIVEKTATTERLIERQTQGSTDAIQHAAGADTPVPPDVLSAWRVGLSKRTGPADDHGS